MRIDSVAVRPDRAGRYRIVFGDGSILRIYRQTLEDHGLYSGMELNEQQLDKLRKDAGKMSARMRAVRIVTASNVSEKDLERRLVQKGERPEDAQTAVQWMSDMELLDDRRTAEQIVNSCIRKGYGPARAKQALYEKQIPREYWEEVLEDYPNQTEYMVSFLRSRLGEAYGEPELRRATAALQRRGHSYGSIREALRQLEIDEEYLEE